jgi:predicted amidohydrolase
MVVVRQMQTHKKLVSTCMWFAVLSTAGSAWGAPAKVALLHTFPALGDDDANVATLETLVEVALLEGANIVVTPELATTGFAITRTQVENDLGFTSPFPELAAIEDLADQHDAYVLVAIAEVAPPSQVFNTVVVFGPDGLVTTVEKRGLTGFHDRGILPFDVIPTVYGDLGVMICSDSYLPDWFRILSMNGADIVLLPANWFGSSDQHEIWQTRARENSTWFFTANRWGEELDTRFGFPFLLEMDDAPSAVISPDGELQLFYRAMDVPEPVDEILTFEIEVPAFRIGNELTPSYSLNFRRPEAYGAIANEFYDRDTGNQMVPNLPPDGTTRIASIAYQPSLLNANANLNTIASLWAAEATTADVVVLPGRGITSVPVNTSNPNWHQAAPWTGLQSFVEANDFSLLVTTLIQVSATAGLPDAVVLVRPNEVPILSRQIHDSLIGLGTGDEPTFIDLAHARVGVLTGRDALFPEAITALTKSGTDILVISSAVGVPVTSHDVNAPAYFWEPAALLRMWKTRSNDNLHVAASDWTGNGVVIEETGGIIGTLQAANAGNQVAVLNTITNSDPFSFDSVRVKFLNHYYSFDLEALLGP